MTAVEIDRNSVRVRVFHRTGRGAWTHPVTEKCEVCTRDGR